MKSSDLWSNLNVVLHRASVTGFLVVDCTYTVSGFLSERASETQLLID